MMAPVTPNPFRPSFGVTPPLLAGRDTEILAFGDALDAGPGAPGRATLYTGVRGIGKTVMLNEAETQARQRGWVVVSETAVPGLVDRLTTHRLPEAAAALELSSIGRRVTAVALPFHLGGLTWQTPAAEHHPDLRAQLTALTDHLADHGTGLLLTVDELHRADREGLRELAATVQHCFREERPIAFAGAGLPTAIADLLNDDVLTFLRRADRYHLGAVDPADVADAIRTPLSTAGYRITDPALQAVTNRTVVSSIAASTVPAGPNTGMAMPQASGSSSPRAMATPVSRVTARARRNRSAEVTVCGGYARRPRRIIDSTVCAEENASSARPNRGGVRGQGGRRREHGRRPRTRCRLDVGDAHVQEHAQPGAILGGGAQILQHTGTTLRQGCRVPTPDARRSRCCRWRATARRPGSDRRRC